MYIIIDGETLAVQDVFDHGHLTMLETDGGDFYLAESAEEAGKEAREYWADMAEGDPEEFACLVGPSVLVNWALGILDGPGSTAVRSLDEWLDLWLDTPEEQWAAYDGEEREARGPSVALQDGIGLAYNCRAPWVAYRWN